MRSLATVGLVSCFAVLCPRTSAAQPVTAEAAIAAELEISTADPRIGILSLRNWTYDHREPALDSADASVELESWAGSSDLIRRLWAQARVRGALGAGSFLAISRATPQLELVNGTDATVRLQGYVHIPDVLHPRSPGEYFYAARTDEGLTQIALVELGVNLITGSLEGSGDSLLFADAQTRSPLTPLPGPRQVDVFGVPFSLPILLDVPPSIREVVSGDEVIIEIAPFGVRLVVHAEASGFVHESGGGASEPLILDPELMCREQAFPPRAFPVAPLARLCRADRPGASAASIADAPICSCLRDDALRTQRCTFQFADLEGRAKLTAPLAAGETGLAEWTFHPAGKVGGVYELQAALLVDGKWVPAGRPGKGRQARRRGTYAAGEPIRQRVKFEAPKRPTVLRTLLRLWPEGAKTPIESVTDAFVALRKPRLAEQ